MTLLPSGAACGSAGESGDAAVAVPAAQQVAGEPAGSADTPPADPGYTDITPERLADILARGDYLIVNVHVPYEGEIPGTDVHIPFDRVEEHLANLPEDRGAGIVLYCRSGRMSRSAAADLRELGFTNLLHLDGGMLAWEAAGYPLEHADPAR